MTQYDFGSLDPNIVTGTNLAQILRQTWDALQSCHSGPSRPDYAVTGMWWINTSGTPWIVNVFDGTDDIQVATLNANTNTFQVTLGADAIGTLNISDASIVEDHMGFTKWQRPQSLGGTTVTSASGVLALDFSLRQIQQVPLTENVTSITLTPPNMIGVGRNVPEVEFIQAATPFTISGWPANVRWTNGVPLIGSESGLILIATLKWNGSLFLGSWAEYPANV